MRDTDLLLRNLDQAWEAKAWHGTNLRGSLRGVKLDELGFRPGPGRNNIWELALHCAYWKYAVRRRLTGEKRGAFPLKGSNFFRRPQGEPTSAAWRADLELLVDCHTALRAVVADLPARRLGQRVRGSQYTVVDTVLGIAAHDLYHAGQIQLLKRLARQR
jgi:uncharacterized damage-inducible protein DinB